MNQNMFGKQLFKEGQNSKFLRVACFFLLSLLFKGKSRKGSLVYCHTRCISLLYISSMLQ